MMGTVLEEDEDPVPLEQSSPGSRSSLHRVSAATNTDISMGGVDTKPPAPGESRADHGTRPHNTHPHVYVCLSVLVLRLIYLFPNNINSFLKHERYFAGAGESETAIESKLLRVSLDATVVDEE